jgi:hypothetical protein
MKLSFVIAIGLIFCLVPASVCHGEAADDLVNRLKQEIDASDQASDAVKAFVKDVLIAQCANPVFVAEVKKQNDKGVALEQIKKIDQEWMDAEEELPIHVELTTNACAKEIVKLAKAHNTIGEVFVMDNQGANVGQNELTSDYWQGDEPKWQKSFAEGKGGVDVDKEKLDKSTNIVDQKISLPIIDTDGKVIGAVCWGIKTGNL